jgi:hypothetical protein
MAGDFTHIYLFNRAVNLFKPVTHGYKHFTSEPFKIFVKG